MSTINRRLLLGGGLILAGILFLLESLHIFAISGLAWGIAFVVGGLVFLYFLLENKENWWAAIPGFVLIGIGATILVSSFAILAPITGSVMLAFIGLGFWVVYLLNRKFWWAVIPGGVLVTLAVVAGVSGVNENMGTVSGGIFFLGLAATFGLLGILPGSREMKWPFIPAGILAIMGLLILATSSSLVNLIWPIALVLLGLFLIARSALRR